MHKITKENDKYKWGVYVSTPQEEKSDLLTLQYNNATLFDTEEAAEDAFKKRFSPKNMLTRMCQKVFFFLIEDHEHRNLKSMIVMMKLTRNLNSILKN